MLLDLFFLHLEGAERGLFFLIDPGHIVEEVFHVHIDLFLQLAEGDFHGADPLALAAFRATTGKMHGMDQMKHGFFGQGSTLTHPVWIARLGDAVILAYAHGTCVTAGIAADAASDFLFPVLLPFFKRFSFQFPDVVVNAFGRLIGLNGISEEYVMEKRGRVLAGLALVRGDSYVSTF